MLDVRQEPNLMEKLAFYLVTFGMPILLYLLWLARLTKQVPFLGLLIVAIVAVWITLWPVYFGPEHRRASAEINDRADTVMTGFILLGWFNGLIGCLPIILVEVPRSIVLMMRKRRANRTAKNTTQGEQAVASNRSPAPTLESTSSVRGSED